MFIWQVEAGSLTPAQAADMFCREYWRDLTSPKRTSKISDGGIFKVKGRASKYRIAYNAVVNPPIYQVERLPSDF